MTVSERMFFSHKMSRIKNKYGTHTPEHTHKHTLCGKYVQFSQFKVCLKKKKKELLCGMLVQFAFEKQCIAMKSI